MAYCGGKISIKNQKGFRYQLFSSSSFGLLVRRQSYLPNTYHFGVFILTWKSLGALLREFGPKARLKISVRLEPGLFRFWVNMLSLSGEILKIVWQFTWWKRKRCYLVAETCRWVILIEHQRWPCDTDSTVFYLSMEVLKRRRNNSGKQPCFGG